MNHCKQKRLSISLEDYLQINVFLNWWWLSKKNELTLYQEATKSGRKKAVRGQPARYGKPDSWDVNMTINLLVKR